MKSDWFTDTPQTRAMGLDRDDLLYLTEQLVHVRAHLHACAVGSGEAMSALHMENANRITEVIDVIVSLTENRHHRTRHHYDGIREKD
jgi:hypothetical protein